MSLSKRDFCAASLVAATTLALAPSAMAQKKAAAPLEDIVFGGSIR